MMEPSEWLIVGGLTVGAIFGIVAQRFRFCMVAGISNWYLIKDYRQIFAFSAALFVAIGGTQLLEFTQTVDIASSSYRNTQFDWLGVIIGGVIFGVGGTLAGGCATRTIIKTAEGSLQGLIALLSFMVFAAMTQFMFPLMNMRLAITNTTDITLSTDAGVAFVLGLPTWLPVAGALLVMVGIIYFFRKRGINWPMLIGGAICGAMVVAGWYTTGVLAEDPFASSESLSAITVSGPMARMGYLLMTGNVPAFSFTIAFVIGVFLFALLTALMAREFRFTALPKGMLGYTILGGGLMGIGGTMAYGCNLGQGMSGVSTLSIESILAFFSMFLGTVLTVRWWEKRS
jgi:uncharacterized membrane protein YedE/YeeE